MIMPAMCTITNTSEGFVFGDLAQVDGIWYGFDILQLRGKVSSVRNV